MNPLDLFMLQLKIGLNKVPKSIADDVIQYYDEFIDDARKAGRSDEEILSRLGTPERIIRSTLDDISITAAQSNPNPVSLLKTSRRMLGRGAVRAARGTSLALLSLFPLLAAIVFYMAAFAFALAAPGAAAVLIWSIISHPGLLMPDILAQAGLILSLVCICLLLAWGLRICANSLGCLTLEIFRTISSRNKADGVAVSQAVRRNRRMLRRTAAILLTFFLAAGIAFAAAGGLYQRYFALWNSTKPSDIEVVTEDIPASVNQLTIKVLNSNVEIVRAHGQKAGLYYERPPYFEMSEELSGGYLSLSEIANGHLPLVDVLAIHEGMTVLRIALPGDTADVDLEIQTIGGNIDIGMFCRSVKVTTYNGNITLHTPDGTYNGKLESANGKISILTD